MPAESYNFNSFINAVIILIVLLAQFNKNLLNNRFQCTKSSVITQEVLTGLFCNPLFFISIIATSF